MRTERVAVRRGWRELYSGSRTGAEVGTGWACMVLPGGLWAGLGTGLRAEVRASMWVARHRWLVAARGMALLLGGSGLLSGSWLLGGSGLRAQTAEVQLAFQHGAAALREGRNGDAEREFRRAVRLEPELAEAHLDLGLVLGREGKGAEAIESLRKALALNGKLEGAHMFLGVFLYQAGRSDEAIASLHEELVLYPENGEALSWLGIAELAAGRPERAVEPLDRASALAPKDLNILEYRGRAHRQVAELSYARMAAIDPDAWQVHKVQAELYASDNRDREAIGEYEAALKREGRNPDLYEGLGDARRRLNELGPAREAYARELELAPQNPIAMYDLGSTEVELGDAKAGVPLLEGMLKVYRASPTAEYYLGRGLAESGRDADGAAQLERCAKDDPEGEAGQRAWFELARIYRRLKRPEDAQRASAAYTALRERDEKKKAARVADWRKLNAQPGGAGSQAGAGAAGGHP